MSLPDEDKKMHFRKEFIDELAMILGGYATEKEIFGDITTGASNDLQKATDIAKRLVTRYGMSEQLGPRTYGEREEMIFLGKEIHENRDYSEKTAQDIDKEVLDLLSDALKTAKSIVHEHRDKIDKVVDVLLDKETIEKDEFVEIVGPAEKSPALKVAQAK